MSASLSSTSSAPVLSHNHVFGLSSAVNDNIHFIDENVIVYPAGHLIIIYNIEKRTQRFLFGSDGSRITALALSPNRRFVAIAESSITGADSSGDTGTPVGGAPGEQHAAVITVFDVQSLRKRKVLTSGQVSSYVSIGFSPDGKYLISLGSEPDHILTNWLWEKIRPMHSVKLTAAAGADIAAAPLLARRCLFGVHDPTLIALVGQSLLSIYRVQTGAGQSAGCLVHVDIELGAFRDVLAAAAGDLVACAWSRDVLVVAARSGALFLIQSGAVRHSITVPTGPIGSLVAFQLGSSTQCIGVGGAGGILYLIDIVIAAGTGGDMQFGSTIKTLNVRPSGVPSSGDISSMSMSPSDELLALTTSSSRAFLVTIGNIDVLKPDEIRFDDLIDPGHCGAILGLDLCVRKPLIVSCGVDSSIRIWNYVERTIECTKFFAEQPLSVSMHPNGFQIVAGFADKIRLLNVLMDDIRPYKEFNVKNCREIAFSAGGHMFAAVHGSLIVVYATYTGELVSTLRGHNQKVSSIQWAHEDSAIVSSGTDGAVYEFALRTGQREREYVQKGCKYTCAVTTSDGRIYAVSNDHVLKEIADSAVQKELDAGTVLTQILLSHPIERMLFAGTESGLVRSLKFPLTGHCQDYVCHAGPVCRLRIAHDDSMLFSAGVDGCIAIFDVREKEGRANMPQATSAGANQLVWSQEILVTRSDLEERTATINELKSRVDELTLHNEYQIRLQDVSHSDKLKEIKDSFQIELENEKRAYETVKEEKQDMEMEYEERVRRVEEAHAAQMGQCKQEHQDAIMAEVESYHDLEIVTKREEEDWSRHCRGLEEAHQERLDLVQIDLEEQLDRQREIGEKLTEEREAIVREFKETKRQLEQDTDAEIVELKDRFDATLATERETTLRLKGENGIMKKRFSSLSNDIEDQKEELKAMSDKEVQVHEQITKLRHDIEVHKGQIASRDTTIGEKERKIYELKKRNQELEKHKFVLDHQIKELKRQIEPRECQIAEMQTQENEIDQQLESLHEKNGALRDQIGTITNEIATLQQEINRHRKVHHDLETTGQRQRFHLHQMVQYVQDPAKLVDQVRVNLDRYPLSGGSSATFPDEIDEQVSAEYQRQTAFLEASASALKGEVSRDIHRHKQDTMRIAQENIELIKEINQLRKQLTGLKMTINSTTIS